MTSCIQRSKTPWRTALVAAGFWGALMAWPLGVSSAPTGGVSVLPSLGDAAGEDMDLGAERRLGERIMREIRRDPDVVDDPLLMQHLQSMWGRLVLAARARGELTADLDTHLAFETFLVRDRSINAFALPGGFVGVHLGLIAMTASQDELAAVLAHELSHVTQRHIARSLASSRRQTMLGTTAMILGMIAASRSGSIDAANAAIVGGQAAMIQGQLNFSRDMEREADRVGFGVLDQAGFAPAGMSAMFDKLQQASRLNDSQQFPYLRSHPLTSERIGEARARLTGTATAGASTVGAPSDWEHAAMQGRARALMDPRAVSQQRLMQVLGGSPVALSTPANLASVYAGTLAAIRMKDWVAAEQGLQRLRPSLAAHPELARAVSSLSVELALERGQGAEAQQLLAQRDDGSRPALILAARAALLAGRGQAAAMQALQGLVAATPTDASAWQWLSQLQDKQGQPLAALRSAAEAQWALGDLSGAVDRLRAAQRAARAQRADSVDASIIDARLRQLEERLKRETLEERENRGRAP